MRSVKWGSGRSYALALNALEGGTLPTSIPVAPHLRGPIGHFGVIARLFASLSGSGSLSSLLHRTYALDEVVLFTGSQDHWERLNSLHWSTASPALDEELFAGSSPRSLAYYEGIHEFALAHRTDAAKWVAERVGIGLESSVDLGAGFGIIGMLLHSVEPDDWE